MATTRSREEEFGKQREHSGSQTGAATIAQSYDAQINRSPTDSLLSNHSTSSRDERQRLARIQRLRAELELEAAEEIADLERQQLRMEAEIRQREVEAEIRQREVEAEIRQLRMEAEIQQREVEAETRRRELQITAELIKKRLAAKLMTEQDESCEEPLVDVSCDVIRREDVDRRPDTENDERYVTPEPSTKELEELKISFNEKEKECSSLKFELENCRKECESLKTELTCAQNESAEKHNEIIKLKLSDGLNASPMQKRTEELEMELAEAKLNLKDMMEKHQHLCSLLETSNNEQLKQEGSRNDCADVMKRTRRGGAMKTKKSRKILRSRRPPWRTWRGMTWMRREGAAKRKKTRKMLSSMRPLRRIRNGPRVMTQRRRERAVKRKKRSEMARPLKALWRIWKGPTVMKRATRATKFISTYDAPYEGTYNSSSNHTRTIVPRLQQDLRYILRRWRLNRHCVAAVIVQMYRPREYLEDANYQRVSCNNRASEARTYYERTIPIFGTACTSHLPEKPLHQLTTNSEKKYSITANRKRQDRYRSVSISAREAQGAWSYPQNTRRISKLQKSFKRSEEGDTAVNWRRGKVKEKIAGVIRTATIKELSRALKSRYVIQTHYEIMIRRQIEKSIYRKGTIGVRWSTVSDQTRTSRKTKNYEEYVCSDEYTATRAIQLEAVSVVITEGPTAALQELGRIREDCTGTTSARGLRRLE